MVVEYKNGAKMPLSSYSQMLARTARIEASNTGTFDRCKELNIDLVRCTIVPNCCPYCKKYEGKVYSISGKDKRFPALYETALSKGYNIMHPNCRHEFVSFIEEMYSEEELKKIIADSNHFEEFNPKDERLFKIYNRDQALQRQWIQEHREYKEAKALYGKDFPYKSLQGFRRASRANSEQYQIIHNRNIDNKQYERWKGIVGEKNMPETLAKFQDLKYNNTKEFEFLRGFKEYKVKYSDADVEEYRVVSKIKEIGLRGEPTLRPERIDTKDFSFNEEHINKTDHQRNITREEAESYIDNAVLSLKQWKGQRITYYSLKGATVIDIKTKRIITSYSEKDFDNEVNFVMEEIEKWKAK